MFHPTDEASKIQKISRYFIIFTGDMLALARAIVAVSYTSMALPHAIA